MTYLLGIAAAAFLGVGWVLQQRVAADQPDGPQLSWRVLRHLVSSLEWWGGIAGMAIGQSLAAWALQDGPVTIVEPLLVGSLLFAFATSSLLGRHPVRPHEIVGTLLVVGAVALFLGVAVPHAAPNLHPGWGAVVLATAACCAVAALVVAGGRWAGRRKASIAASTTAAAAGVLYSLQDVATRGAIVAVRGHGLLSLVETTWPYVLLFGATAGVLLSQDAFRAARLDLSLPPTAAVQPLAGVALGVGLLGDELDATWGALAAEALSIVIGVLGVILIGRRMRAMRDMWAPRTTEPQKARS